MPDLADTLRQHATHTLMDGSRDLLRAAADEIERLREAIRRLADQDATLSVVGGNVIVQMDATLTDAERERLKEYAEGWKIAWQNERGVNNEIVRLARLLET
jgi:hypothetical protein